MSFLPDFSWPMIPYVVISSLELAVSSSRLYRFTLVETFLHKSVQFGLLDVSAGNKQVGFTIRVYFSVRTLPELSGWEMGKYSWLRTVR